eukprot:scaffold1868_cov194-Alexandrium_tamarense.AAC.4
MGKERGCASREVYRRFEEDVRGGQELKCRGYKQMAWSKKEGIHANTQQPNPTGHREREGNYPSH